jgi:hypothetical protein
MRRKSALFWVLFAAYYGRGMKKRYKKGIYHLFSGGFPMPFGE